MKFNETSLAHGLSHRLYYEQGYDVAEIHIDKLYYILFRGIAGTLKDNKSKEHPTSFVINELDGKMVAAMTVEYFENGDNPGNWTLTWTFDEEDLPANTKKIELQNDLTHSYFRVASGEKYGIIFEDRTCLVVTMTYCAEHLYKWLDENAKEGSTIDVELDNVFSASVVVEDGKKVMSVEPAGEIKTFIKEDAAIEA